MLWTTRQARVAARALVNTFVWPWDWWLGVAMLCARRRRHGTARVARLPRVFVTAASLVFAPYAMFHLLFQETATTRYALPLVCPVAYYAGCGAQGLPARALPAAAIGIGGDLADAAVPASRAVRARGRPVFRAFDDMATPTAQQRRKRGSSAERSPCAMHAAMRRAQEWAARSSRRGYPGAPRPRVAGARRSLEDEARRPASVRRRTRAGPTSRCSTRTRASSRAPIAGGFIGAALRRRRPGRTTWTGYSNAAAGLDARSRLVADRGSRPASPRATARAARRAERRLEARPRAGSADAVIGGRIWAARRRPVDALDRSDRGRRVP